MMQILGDALELERPQRALFLDEACRGDLALRAEVERLLGQESQAADHLATEHGALNLLESIIPRQVGRYRIIRPLGEGGMGMVYLAAQQEPVRRVVALKLIRPGMDSREVVARFESERQALALMSHPNVAHVYDAGATDLGRPYFVMEYVSGVPITEYCDQHRLGIHARLALFIQVCDAIQHAHQKGIIHRDLKPSNVLVTEHEDRPIPKVIDFGVAKAVQQSFTDRTLYTERGQLIGTPEYMSPEQALGSGLDIDTRTDIYSLGVLLYELLTGTLPIDPKTLRKSGLHEIQRTLREVEPPSPSKRLSSLGAGMADPAHARRTDLGTLRRQMKGDLDWIVMKAMEKDRTRRYASASALADDVQRFLRHEPVLAGPPSTIYVLRKFARRHRAALISATALAVVLIGAVVVSSALAVRARRAETLAVQSARLAREEAQRSEQVAAFLSEMLRGVNPAVAQGRDTTLLKEILDRTAERVGTELQSAPLVEADLRMTLGQTYYGLGLYSQAQEMYRQALRLRQQAHPEEDPTIAESLSAMGAAELALGRHDQAEDSLRRSLELRRRLLGDDHPSVAESLNNLASVRRARGDLPGAERLLRETVSVLRKRPSPEDERLAVTLGNLAGVLRLQFKFDEAESALRQAMEIRRKLLGEKHPGIAAALNSLAVLKQDSGDLDAAERLFHQVLELRREIYGPKHPDVSESLYNLSRLYDARRDHRRALDYARQSAEMRLELFGEVSLPHAQAMYDVAYQHHRLGELDPAERTLRECLRLFRESGHTTDPLYPMAVLRMARMLTEFDRHTEAQPYFEEALESFRKFPAMHLWRVGYTQILLGGCIVRQRADAAAGSEALAQAERMMLEGWEIMRSSGRAPADSSGNAMWEIALMYDARKMPDKAAEWRDRAAAATQPATTPAATRAAR